MAKAAPSQESQVYLYLAEDPKRSITQREAIAMFDCTRLATVVEKLKAKGHEFETFKRGDDQAYRLRKKYHFPEDVRFSCPECKVEEGRLLYRGRAERHGRRAEGREWHAVVYEAWQEALALLQAAEAIDGVTGSA